MLVGAFREKKTGRQHVIFGLSDGNVDKLREDLPILAQAARLGITSFDCFVITYCSNGKGAVPDDLEKETRSCIIALTDDDLEGMQKRMTRVKLEDADVLLFRAPTEDDLSELVKGMVGPNTRYSVARGVRNMFESN